MRILQSGLALQAGSLHQLHRTERHTLQFVDGGPPQTAGDRRPGESAVVIRISEEAQRLAAAADSAASGVLPSRSQAADIDAAFEAAEKDPHVQLVRSMIEFLTGRPVSLRFAGERVSRTDARDQDGAPLASAASPANGGPGMIYRRQEIREEYEAAHFKAEGTVETADGQRIRFSLTLAIERYQRNESTQEVRAGSAVRKDPLVLNFGGSADLLGNGVFRFDLDGDGEAEALPAPAAGTAFLVFDRNANGRVDDRSELFGPQTDNGFDELAILDTDGNGWIDEGDPDFARLGLWQPDATGSGPIVPLTDHAVGAIATASADTRFSLRDDSGTDLGLLRRTGVALTDDARTIAVHELDMTRR